MKLLCLPDELLLKIFLDCRGHKNSIQLVCRRFKYIFNDPIFWNEVDLQPVAEIGILRLIISVDDNTVRILCMQKFIQINPVKTAIQKIKLHYCANITNSSIIFVLEKCRYLHSIDLSFCGKLTDASVFLISTSCPTLSELVLRWLTCLTDKSLNHIQDNLLCKFS